MSQPNTSAGLSGDAAARKAAPIASGVLFYFPNALAAVANLSKVGNEQHNPGHPMHWVFDKSSDEADCIVRHLAQSGTIDTDGVPHSVKVAWRALALLERELLAANPQMEPGKNVRNFSRGGVWRVFREAVEETNRMITFAMAGLYSNEVWLDEIDDDPLDDLVLTKPYVPQVGDRARVLRAPHGIREKSELVGTVVTIESDYPDNNYGEDERYRCSDGWNYAATDLELVERLPA